MLPLITTKIKDDILQWLSENTPLGSPRDIDMTALQKTVGIDNETIEAIFEDFEKMGLISDINVGRFGTFVNLKLHVKAHTFIQRGGFAVEDALTEANMQKILLELENLQKQIKGKPDQLETFNKISTIVSSIAAVYAAFSGGK